MVKVGVSGINSLCSFPQHPHLFLMAFLNGSIGVFDVAQRKVVFMSEPGHSATVFDCCFQPGSADILATGSHDGYLKLWNIATGETERELSTHPTHFAEEKEVIYAVSFSSEAEGKICAVTRIGALHIWMLASGKEVLSQQLTANRQPAYRCDWRKMSGSDPRMIAVGAGGDASGGFAYIVDSSTGQVEKQAHHPGGDVMGVAWHPADPNQLCTACQDGHLRLWDVGLESPSQCSVLYTFSGHTARVFNVAFHPIVHCVVASTSDDRTVRVWDISTPASAEKRKLVGHLGFTRALLWHSECANILFSGSWDSTVRMWDVSTATCLYVATEHHGDVYGLTASPLRPFLLISSSRDTSLRFWTCEDLALPFLLQALLKPTEFPGMTGEAATNDVFGERPRQLLAGSGAQQVAMAMSVLSDPMGSQKVDLYRMLLSFFSFRNGLTDLWDICKAIRGEQPSSSSHRIVHEMGLITAQSGDAHQLLAQTGVMGGTTRREERIMKAADIFLRIGDLRSYCGAMCEAGHWERALCVAPAVSHEYWQELCRGYAQQLDSTSPAEAGPYLIATGLIDRLREFHLERKELETGFLVAKAHCDGRYPSGEPRQDPPAQPMPPLVAEAARDRMQDVAATMATRYMLSSEGVQAAECYLAVNSIPQAVELLLRCHEPALAYVVSDLLGIPHLSDTVQLLALEAERVKLYYLAHDYWQLHPEKDEKLALFLSRHHTAGQGRASEQLSYYKGVFAQALASENHPLAVVGAVCSSDFDTAAQTAVSRMFNLCADRSMFYDHLPEMRHMIWAVASIPLHTMEVKTIASVLAFASFVGLLDAIQKGYYDVTLPLAQTVRNIVYKQKLDFPVPVARVLMMDVEARAGVYPQQAIESLQSLAAESNVPDDMPPLINSLMAQLLEGVEREKVSRGGEEAALQSQIVLVGSSLPAGGCAVEPRVSILTNRRIRGSAVVLEDGCSFISQAEAASWSRVNPFSPLNTGRRILPP
mmetsp:Transcript_35779/g.80479  ORF Transcript_35779/g.80479 Transcript_35779/m.80479 type:complete len:990 (-) Transcript_35779:121-3090(-)